MKIIRAAHPANVLARESWPSIIAWLVQTSVSVHGAFAPHIARLDLQN